MQPGVRGSYAGLQPKTFDRHRAQRGRNGQIDQQGRSRLAPQRFVETDDSAVTRDELMSTAFPNFFENGVEQRRS